MREFLNFDFIIENYWLISFVLLIPNYFSLKWFITHDIEGGIGGGTIKSGRWTIGDAIMSLMFSIGMGVFMSACLIFVRLIWFIITLTNSSFWKKDSNI